MAQRRVLKRANGTRQVQINWGKTGGKRKIEYVGSARTDEEIELLLAEARERINAALINELVEAADDRHLARTVARYARLDLLLLDELAYATGSEPRVHG